MYEVSDRRCKVPDVRIKVTDSDSQASSLMFKVIDLAFKMSE